MIAQSTSIASTDWVRPPVRGRISWDSRQAAIRRRAEGAGRSPPRENAVRRSREEAARTRRTAVAAASRLFRQRGIEAVSVADVMAQVGLTAGGFYRHFESKEALAKEACAEAFAQSGLARQPGSSPGAILRRYLSKAHRDAPSAGGPVGFR